MDLEEAYAMRSGFMRVLLVITSLLIIIGVILMLLMIGARDTKNIIEVELVSERTNSVEFDRLSLIPGASVEYTLLLTSELDEVHEVHFDFCEIGDNELKNYAYAKIIHEGEVTCDMPLSELFCNVITIPVDITETKGKEVTLIYYLPSEVGNEAQGAESVIQLLITSRNTVEENE